MPFDNRFYSFREFDAETLDEILREAEALIQAQLTAANAADQRAMAWAGFLITLATAATAGAAAIATGEKHLFLAVVTGLYAALIGIAAWKAAHSAKPSDFALPGNSPINWLPKEWQDGQPRDFQQARIEQANALQNCIVENREWANASGKSLRESMTLTFLASALGALFTAAYLVYQAVT